MTDVRTTTVIAWRDRPELARTLRHNTPFLRAMRSDVIVVNCGGDSRALRQILGAGDLVPALQIDLPYQRFNKPFALNVGVHEARPGVVFILDADILLTASLAPYAERCARENCFALAAAMSAIPPRAPIFVPPAGSVLETVFLISSVAFRWADGTVTEVMLERTDCSNTRIIAPGIVLARKEHLVEVGGYRSDLVGWGWEDIDLQVRLLRRGLQCVYIDEEIRHLEHGDDKRDLDGPRGAAKKANRRRVWDAYAAGRLVGTYESDIQAWQAASQPAGA